jgi:hypothetical protein
MHVDDDVIERLVWKASVALLSAHCYVLANGMPRRREVLGLK